ncbi:hypothetical protein GCM10009564_27160 [Streptomyces thermogriseus]|uniref:DUF397 domain-containing protein n=1 Tax=Streptomyces thermogriseus TaxID=75292 RepID=A0ABP4DGW3_9ACTN
MSTSEPAWFKSSYSGGSGDNCIEVALRPGIVLVRDSKDTQKQASEPPAGWRSRCPTDTSPLLRAKRGLLGSSRRCVCLREEPPEPPCTETARRPGERPR